MINPFGVFFRFILKSFKQFYSFLFAYSNVVEVREHKFPRPYAHAVRSRAEGTYRARGISHANEM